MPIEGLSTREAAKPSFRNLGKLRKGGPKQKDRPGVDLKYFRFTSDNPDIVVAFTAAYGDKPNALDIFLPHETMGDCFSSWREEYGQNRLCKLRCDGRYWIKWIDGLTVHTKRRECDRPYRDTENRCPECPAGYVGRLEVIPRKLWEAGYIGVVTVETHAVNDIGTIAGKLVQHEPLRGIEFKLSRVERRISAPNKKTGKRIAVTKSLLSLEPTRDWILSELDAAEYRRIAELNGESPTALSATTETTVEEAEFATAVVEEGKAEAAKETEAPGEKPKQESKKKPAAPSKVNGKRPYTAKAVRESIEDLIEGDDGTPISDLQVGLVAGKLDECFAGDKDAKLKRHSVTLHLFNKESCKDLTQAEASAILRWVLATQEKDSTGDYPLHVSAPAEAAAIVKASLIVAGQTQMDL